MHHVILRPLVSKSVDGGREKVCVFGKLSKFVDVGEKKKEKKREKTWGQWSYLYVFDLIK